jgi:hypothetical protein
VALVALFALVAIVGVLGCGRGCGPDAGWSAPPDEPAAVIDERWARVAAWAAIDDVPDRDRARLLRAVSDADGPRAADGSRAAPDDRALVELEHQLTRDRGARASASELPPRLVRAVDALAAWAREGGGTGRGSCAPPWPDQDPLSGLGAYRLGRVALALAEDDEADPRVVATLHLARSLRAAGPSLYAAVGTGLFEHAVRWAVARRVKLGPVFAAAAPRVDEALPMIAREYVCAYERDRALGVKEILARHRRSVAALEALRSEAAGAAASLLDAGVGPLLGDAGARLLDGIVHPKPSDDLGEEHAVATTDARELAMFRQALGRRVTRLEPHRGDLEALEREVDELPPGGRPKSFLVRGIMQYPQGHVVRQLGHAIEVYRAAARDESGD